MLSSLSSRLLAAESDFVSSLTNGEEAILAFNQRWERLVEDVDVALESTALDEELASLMHATAERIATLADISADIYVNYNTFTSQLIDQIDSLMSELTIVDDDHVLSPTLIRPFEKVTRSCSHGVSRKRRRDSSRDPTQDTCKRTRTAGPRTHTPTSSRCPPRDSPAPPSVPASHKQTTESNIPSPCARQDTAANHSRSRKRRLSASDASGPPVAIKRLRTGPRIHAVSDSFVSMRSTNDLEPVSLSSWTSSTPSPCLPSEISIPLDIQALNILSDPTTAFDGDFPNIWKDPPVESCPASNGLDSFLQFLVTPIEDSPTAPTTHLDNLISLAPPCPLSPSALATLPLEYAFDYPDSPSTLASGSSRPVTPLDFADDLELTLPHVVGADGSVAHADDGTRLPSYTSSLSPYHALGPSHLELYPEFPADNWSLLSPLHTKSSPGVRLNDVLSTKDVSSVVRFSDFDHNLPLLFAHDLDPNHPPRLELLS